MHIIHWGVSSSADISVLSSLSSSWPPSNRLQVLLVMTGLTIVLAIPYFLLRKKAAKSAAAAGGGGISSSFTQLLQQSRKKQSGHIN